MLTKELMKVQYNVAERMMLILRGKNRLLGEKLIFPKEKKFIIKMISAVTRSNSPTRIHTQTKKN